MIHSVLGMIRAEEEKVLFNQYITFCYDVFLVPCNPVCEEPLVATYMYVCFVSNTSY